MLLYFIHYIVCPLCYVLLLGYISLLHAEVYKNLARYKFENNFVWIIKMII